MDSTRPRSPALLLLLALSVGFADPAWAFPGSAAWTRQFGTRQADEAQAVALDGSGNAYVVGWTFGTLPGQASAGTVDALVRKVDPEGNELWTRQFGSWDSDFARSVAIGLSGDVYVVGETDGTLPGQHSSGGRDAFIRRYDPGGTERWTRQFGGPGGDGADGVAVDSEGDAYVVGTTAAALPGQTWSGDYDAFIRKYDGAGHELWTRQFGTAAGDGARGIALDPAGRPIVVGSTEGSLPGQHSAGGFDAFVRQYDAAGNELWTRQFGSPADDYAVAVAIDPAGNPAVAGSTDGALPGESSAGGTEAFLRRFDPAGTPLWTQQFGTGSADEGWGVAVDGVGNTYVVGTTEPRSLTQTTPAKTHCFARKYGAAGEELWVKPFGTDDTDLAFSVAVDQNERPYVAGSTKGTLPGQTSHGERDAYLLRFDSTNQAQSDQGREEK